MHICVSLARAALLFFALSVFMLDIFSLCVCPSIAAVFRILYLVFHRYMLQMTCFNTLLILHLFLTARRLTFTLGCSALGVRGTMQVFGKGEASYNI